ncbi:hypothetical protein HYY74_00720 [Candidatus Woesearchaeota archaeon]|nr:hypothetical protein [Candidatus Woesearchaeota archaeon]
MPGFHVMDESEIISAMLATALPSQRDSSVAAFYIRLIEEGYRVFEMQKYGFVGYERRIVAGRQNILVTATADERHLRVEIELFGDYPGVLKGIPQEFNFEIKGRNEHRRLASYEFAGLPVSDLEGLVVNTLSRVHLGLKIINYRAPDYLRAIGIVE